MSTFDLRALLEALDEAGIRFVVIGGVAVGAHGYLRATEDLDVVPDPDRENLDRLIELLPSLDAKLPTAGDRPFDPVRDGPALRSYHNVTLNTRLGGLDVVQRATGVPSYATLDEEAVDSELLGVPVRICSLRHLRQMKRAIDGAQDRADLENLPEA